MCVCVTQYAKHFLLSGKEENTRQDALLGWAAIWEILFGQMQGERMGNTVSYSDMGGGADSSIRAGWGKACAIKKGRTTEYCC